MTSDSRTHIIDTHRERNRSIDELDRAIFDLAARIDSASHDLLVLVRRFDERGGWLRWGFENCADWLHWRCDGRVPYREGLSGSLFFKRPDGRAVPACGYRAEDMTDDDVDAMGEYFNAHPSAEGFLAGWRNRMPESSPREVAGRGGP